MRHIIQHVIHDLLSHTQYQKWTFNLICISCK